MFGRIKEYKNYIFTLGGFILGFIASVGALNYSGKNLVNVLYFLFFVIFLPFLFSLGTLIFKRAYKDSSLSGLMFSIGAFIGLIITISTRDIAFGWATTLDISAKEFHSFLSTIAIWKGFCNSCVPSVDLVELSRISRLGSGVTPKQMQHAIELGQWWKFLAMSLFVYGILWRLLIYIISLFLKPKPINIDIISPKKEPKFEQIDSSYDNQSSLDTLNSRDFKLIGYNVNKDSLNLKSNDNAKDIVVAIKAYEPPLLEVFDDLDEIISKAQGKVSILLVGLNGKAKKSDVDIWIRKLKELKYNLEVIS